MNLFYISPEFPPNFITFLLRLAQAGVKVWAIGEADFFSMPHELRSSLQWYKQTNLYDWDSVISSIEFMKTQREDLRTEGLSLTESHNEHWLRLESRINEFYNLPGIWPKDIDFWKRKSAMKRRMRENNIPVARGELVKSYSHALALIADYGYPVILKPDEGVGAQSTYCIHSQKELDTIFPSLSGIYILEEFIHGPIVSYDGLTNQQGEVVFENSLLYSQGVLSCVEGDDPSFFITRQIPFELSQLGKFLVNIFQIKKKFFHLEFFKTPNGYIPLEINVRPPGGPILDMMNYSIDGDLYQAYSDMILSHPISLPQEKKYYCGYVGRRNKNYRYSHEKIIQMYGEHLVQCEENPILFQQAMGQYKYIFRTPDLEKLEKMMFHISCKA